MPSLVEIGRAVLKKKTLKFFQCIFSYFVIIFLENSVSFIWTIFSPYHPRMLCATFGWNWPSASGEENFRNTSNIISLFCNYLPLEKGVALHLYKLESPSPKEALCQVWLKLVEWLWRRRWKCEKFTDGRTTGNQISSFEHSAQVS